MWEQFHFEVVSETIFLKNFNEYANVSTGRLDRNALLTASVATSKPAYSCSQRERLPSNATLKKLHCSKPEQ